MSPWRFSAGIRKAKRFSIAACITTAEKKSVRLQMRRRNTAVRRRGAKEI